jgi:phosphoglycerate dehydrogenase-like enzyme
VDREGAVVIGVLYPPEWHGTTDAFEADIAQLRAVDPRIETVMATYVEPHELRTARGAGEGFDPGLVPEVSPETAEAMSRMQVVIAIDLTGDIVELAPGLRWVQAVGAGTAQLQSLGLADAGVRLTSNGGSNSIGIAEFAFGRVIEAAKGFRSLAAAQEDHRWDPAYGHQLAGLTIGLIGYGPINREVAVRARAFGMRVVATRRTADAAAEPPVDTFFGPDRLHEMLAQCDAVVAAAPETALTIGMMNAGSFAAMRPGATFVNVGRGSLVDEIALIAALQSGHLAAAALDVARVEPLPADDPLWDAPNIVISAHCSSAPSALFPNLHRVLRANLRRYLDDEPLLHEVSAERGY